MEFLAVSFEQRLLLMVLIFCSALAALIIFHRYRHQPGWNWKDRVPELVLVGVAMFSLSVLMQPSIETDERIAQEFHRRYHDEWWDTTVLQTRWRGVPLIKTPLDLWVFQDILYETKPDVVIETGTLYGGSAYYFASLFDMFGKGRVLTVDIEKADVPKHDRIQYLIGSSTAPEIVEQLKNSIQEGETVMVVLDSSHMPDHVLDELRLYSDMVSVGHYLIVEDTHLGGNPVFGGIGNPGLAVERFLKERDDFVVDKSREKFVMTWNRGGWLKRVR